MAVVVGPPLAFVDEFTGTLAVGAPTVALSGLEEPPEPITLALKMHARLVVAPADPLEDS